MLRSSHCRGDVEKMQRTFTRMLMLWMGRSYEERMDSLGLFILQQRLRGDLCRKELQAPAYTEDRQSAGVT